MEIIECIQNVKVGSQLIFRKGELIDMDNHNRVPFDCGLFSINFNNPEYFRKYNQKYDVGAYLVYTYEKGNYFCRIAEFIPSSKKYRIEQVSGSFTGIVSERDIVLVDAYHFINTEGIICTTYIGKNKMRDRWLSLTGNMFRNKKDAIDKWKKINGCNYNE